MEPDATADPAPAVAPDKDERRREFEVRVGELETERKQAEEAGDQSSEASALRKIGDLHRAMGLSDGARESYSRARYLFQMAGNSEGAAGILATLGNMEARHSRHEAAARNFHEATDLFQRLGLADKEADTTLSEGDALQTLGNIPGALKCYDAATSIFARLDDTLGQAHTAFRVGMLALDEDPAEAEQHLELAERLYADHVGRDSPGVDAPLPTRVTDSRRYPPFLMQRVCLRERQRLGFVGAPGTGASQSISIHRKSRFIAAEPPSEGTSWTVWLGAALLGIGVLVALVPVLVGGESLGDWIDAIAGVVALGTLIHASVGIFGAVTGIVAGRQMGISAPVVLLAMGIGFGAIFHEISRAVFIDLLPTDPTASVANQAEVRANQATDLARAVAAKMILDARLALEEGDVERATSTLQKSANLAERNLDIVGQRRALEDLVAIAIEHGTLADRLAASEQLFETLRGSSKPREREILESLVALVGRVGDPAKLRETHMKLLAYYDRIGNPEGEVRALLALAVIARDTGDLDSAYEWFNRAHATYQSLRDVPGQIQTLLALGEIDARVGRRRRAYGHYYHAFAMYREIEDEAGQAAMLLHMGTLDEAAERYEEASAAFRQSKRVYEELGDRSGEAQAALRFGNTQAAHGNQRQARDAFGRARDLFHDLGHTAGEARVHLGMGHLAQKKGDIVGARLHYQTARALYAQTGDTRGQLAALRELGSIAKREGSDPGVEHAIEEINGVARQATDPTARARLFLAAGDIAASLDRHERAGTAYREALALFDDLGDAAGGRSARERLARPGTTG